MARDPKVNIKITIDGKEYKAEIDELNRKTKELGNTSEESAAGVSQMARNLRLAASAAAAYAAIGVGRYVVSVGAEFERLNATLESVMGSQDAAAQSMREIQTIAASTPFQITDLTDTFITLKSFGLDPLDGSMQAIIDQAAALGGSQEKLNGIVLALGQAWAKQKLQGEEILQLIERGVPVWGMLEDITGRTAKELQELSSKGKLGRDVIKALMDEMGRRNMGAAAKQANTLNGALSNLTDSVMRATNELGKDSGFLDMVRDAAVWVTELLNSFGAEDRALEMFNQKLAPIVDELRELGVYIRDADATNLARVMNAIEQAERKGLNLDLMVALKQKRDEIASLATQWESYKRSLDAATRGGAPESVLDNITAALERQQRRINEAVNEYAKLTGVTTETAESTQEAADSSQSFAERQAEVERVVRDSYTNIDEFNDEVTRLNALFNAGDISADTYSQRIGQLAEKYGVLERNASKAADSMMKSQSDAVRRSVESPQDTWAREINELNNLWQLGADPQNMEAGIGIDTETYVAAVEQANQRLLDSTVQTTTELDRIWRRTGDAIADSVGEAVSQMIWDNADGMEVLRNLGRQVVRDLTAQLVSYMAKKAALWVAEKAGLISTGAASAATGATVAAAWAPAAAAVSLATLGANAIPANTALVSTFALTKGLALAGMAHDGLENVPREGTYLLQQGERVVSAEDNKKLSRALDEGSVGGGVVVVQNFTYRAAEARGMRQLMAENADMMEAIALRAINARKEMRGE